MSEVQFQKKRKLLAVIGLSLVIGLGLGISYYYIFGIPQKHWGIAWLAESWERFFPGESSKDNQEKPEGTQEEDLPIIPQKLEPELEQTLKTTLNELNVAISNVQYEKVWEKLHPDDQEYWGSKEDYVQAYTKYRKALQEIGYSSSNYEIVGEAKELNSWRHPRNEKKYNYVAEVSLKKTFWLKDKEATQNIKTYWQQISGSWKTFSLTDKEIIKQEIKKLTTIEGLAVIRLSGGTWENWDADIEKDGPVISIVYLDNQGNNISNGSPIIVPISADLKVFTTDKNGELIYSAHYPKEEIIFDDIYPKIRIPKEKMGSTLELEHKYGYVTITIQTPEQGSFSGESDLIILSEQ